MTATDSHILGVVALELTPDAGAPLATLDAHAAGELAQRVAHDIALLAAGVETLDFTLAAAHFDPAEALRPGWPLHRRLEELRARAPGRDRGDARLIAFGADAEGQVPQPLQSDETLRGGSFRILPFILSGDEASVARVGTALESELLDRGMARAETALLAQSAFATQVEHMRYLTAHDLLAMMAMQYANMGLAPLWPIIETAMLSPGDEVELDAPPEPHVRLDSEGEASIALFPPREWTQRYGEGDTDADRLQRRMSHFEARQRQFTAVLEAHGIPVVYEAVA